MTIIKNQYLLFNDNNSFLDIICKNNIMIYDKIENLTNIDLNIVTNYDLNEINWLYDINNYRIPYYKNTKIIYIKFNNLKNIIDWISSVSLLEDNDIITGEKIQKIADIVCGTQSSLQWNPNNIFFSKCIYSINDVSSLHKYKSIFVFTHDLDIFINKFNDQIADKIIITHNSDDKIDKLINCKLHLAQNCQLTHNNIISLPIGIENTQWFDNNIFHEVRKMKIKKSKLIYFYFNLNTHESRNECYNILNPFLTWNTPKSKKDYFIELAKHKFAICPRGNGLDTHRIWECLYLNVIPIIIKKDYLNIDNLPIIILDEWNDIKNIFNKEIIMPCQTLSKVSVTYYSDLIGIRS